MDYKSVSQSAFAKLLGVSPTSVRRYLASGKLDVDRREKPVRIYLNGPKTKAFLAKREPIPESQEKDVIDRLVNSSETFSAEELETIPLSTLKKAKLIIDTKKANTQIAAMSNELITRKSVENFMKSLIGIDYSAIVPLGSNTAYDICAIYETSSREKALEVEKLITKAVYKALDDRYLAVKNYLKSLE